MVRIFKTNVSNLIQGNHIMRSLLAHYPNSVINFDLEDCDNILRVDARGVQSEDIVSQLQNLGFQCIEIEG
ncbi:hypothetical protein [Flavobacterium sp. NKUCC04_CG]|uniref:hypothetical protein n=1 Tax=Flavobacterium sp. NKUCC04_CG TaxID=2842121 RepID=UPI001C5B1DAA|nr:hypothetical protein [Flavobacterium sp. NKUCC04_CG]MBW3520432.1 hypothetical protein [Flavobacterium sp. NKUCC04_CG]